MTADDRTQFGITDLGGTDNDVVLTQLSVASGPQLTKATVLPAGVAQIYRFQWP